MFLFLNRIEMRSGRISCGTQRNHIYYRYARFVPHLPTRKIRKEQKTTDTIIRFTPMRKIVKKMIHPKRVTKKAIHAILEAVVDWLPGVFRHAVLVAAHAGRTTVMKKDLQLVRKIMEKEGRA